MSKFVFKSGAISVNGTSLSDHCSSITVETTADEVDLTAFGATYREFGQGLQDATITATFFQDYASGSVDAVLWPLANSGGTFDVSVAAVAGAISGTNPSYTLRARLFGFNPLGGAVGEASTTDVAFRNAAQTGLTRGTAGTVT